MAKERNVLELEKSKLDGASVKVEVEQVTAGDILFAFECDGESYKLLVSYNELKPLINFLNKNTMSVGSGAYDR